MRELVPSGKVDTRRLAFTVNELIRGRTNATDSVTLTANAASTTVTDTRASPTSAVFFTPTTANGAAEVAAGGMYVSAKANGSFTITHANNAQTDRTFDYVVLTGE